MNRREFLGAVPAFGAALAATGAAAQNGGVSPRVEGDLAWYDVRTWGVEGKGWEDTARYFDRLPARAEKLVRPAVWSLSRHSTGMLVRFETDAPAIHTRYRLLSASLAIPQMPATSVSGVDLYGRDEQGRDRWLGVTLPTSQNVQAEIVSGIDPRPGSRPRLYTLYLPLRNLVESLEIGVPAKSVFRPVAPRTEKPMLFYGTSIMHGASASRSGMSISGILGRRFNRPVINLGFAGNGQMEPEVGALLAELDPCVFAIDCLPNMNGEMVAERAAPLVRQIRQARPETPILLVEDRSLTNAEFLQSARNRHNGSRAALRKAYDELRSSGVKGLWYLKGDDLLGDDGEAATDGSHPSDLGMVRYADAYEKVLRRILKR